MVEDASLSGDPQQHLASAGLRVQQRPEWLVVGPHFAEVPGVHIGGTEDGLPAWSIAIFRTWLSFGRTPRDLLADFAADVLWIHDAADALTEERRGDGATITTLITPAEHNEAAVRSVRVVVQDDERAALLVLYAEPENSAADAVAAELARTLELVPLAHFPDLAAATAAGARLAADLRARGAQPRWGSLPVTTTYRAAGRNDFIKTQRAARGGDPENGYEGRSDQQAGDALRRRVDWTLAGDAVAYTWQTWQILGGPEVEITEQRESAASPVLRRFRLDDRRSWTWSFTPGANFVPPPAEPVVQGWVARGEADAALFEMSTQRGRATHGELMRRLAPEGAYLRVLVQLDYLPEGVVILFDEARAEEQAWVDTSTTYRRLR
jgi:hypothetical protein